MIMPINNPFERIDAVLRQTGRELPRLPDWWPQFLELPADAADEQRLEVYQAVREEGTFEEHEGDFLVCFTVDQIVTRGGRVDAQPLDERISQIGELYKLLAPNRKPLDEGNPVEGQPLGVWQKLFGEQLEQHGEAELAESFRRHPGNLITAARFGQIPFFGSPQEHADVMRAVAQTLYDEISECVHSAWPMGPLRLRWDTRFEFLTLTISPTPIELVGGAKDGKRIDPALNRVDLIRLPGLFSEVLDFSWTVEEDERKYQCLFLLGKYRDCLTVMLSLYAGALETDKPTLKHFQRKALTLPDEEEPDDE